MGRRHRSRRPARRAVPRQVRRRLLVVCEGKVTEPSSVRGFVQWARNATVDVQVAKQQGDPKRVVEIAKNLSKQAAREAHRSGDSFLEYDEIWCVFDRDEHLRFDAACQMAEDNGFGLAISNPCFELWLYLHFTDSPGMRHRHELQKMLGTYLGAYNKHIVFDKLANGGCQGSCRLSTPCRRGHNNPDTGGWCLLRGVKPRPSFRIANQLEVVQVPSQRRTPYPELVHRLLEHLQRPLPGVAR